MFKKISSVFKSLFATKNKIEFDDLWIPVAKEEQNNPNIKKVYVGGLTVDESLSKV